MTKKIVFGVAAIVVSAVLMAPSASAACASPRTASTFGSGTTGYWLPATVLGTSSLQTWQLGAPGTWAGTGCSSDQLFPDGPGFSLNLNLSGCGAGCPSPLATLAVLAQNKTATGTEFLLATVVETPLAANNFDYGPQGNHTMIKVPRPRVLSSSRAATNVNLSVGIDSIAAGLFGPNAASAVTGFNILTASSATDPGTDASAYSLRSTIPNPGGTGATQPVTLDCTNLTDQWIVTQIQFENGTVLGNSVSAATRVRCNPALADPKYKVVPKKVGALKANPN
jgi:hypothetical protein